MKSIISGGESTRCRPATGGQRKRPRGVCFHPIRPRASGSGPPSHLCGTSNPDFLGNKIGPLCFGGWAPRPGDGRDLPHPAQTAKRLRAPPSASLAPILSGWKQTNGGAEICELRPARPFVYRSALCIQDKTRTAPSNRPRRTSSPRYERTARRAKSISRSPKW
jgi:hypothetical protein